MPLLELWAGVRRGAIPLARACESTQPRGSESNGQTGRVSCWLSRVTVNWSTREVETLRERDPKREHARAVPKVV
jgi:hypothetical protein